MIIRKMSIFYFTVSDFHLSLNFHHSVSTGKPIKIYRSQWTLKYTEIYIRWTLSYTFHTTHLSQQITKNVKVYKLVFSLQNENTEQ